MRILLIKTVFNHRASMTLSLSMILPLNLEIFQKTKVLQNRISYWICVRRRGGKTTHIEGRGFPLKRGLPAPLFWPGNEILREFLKRAVCCGVDWKDIVHNHDRRVSGR